MNRLIRFWNSLSAQWLFLWAAALTAMVFSMEFVLSQAMIFMVAIAVFERRGGGLRLRESFRRLPGLFRKEPVWIVVMLPFFIVLFSVFWTEDYAYWLERLRIKLPFLFLPVAFASAAPYLRERHRNLALYLFLWVMFAACVYVLFGYVSNYEEVAVLLSQGRPVPTPSNHIRFSLALAYAVFVAAYLARKRFKLRWAIEVKGLWVLSVFFFVFLHFLSVRSGLLSLYVVLFFLAFRQIFSSQTSAALRRVAWMGLLVIVLLPFLSYRFVPAFRQKLDYMRWDLQQYFSGKEDFPSSDSDRLRSLELGWELAREHPLIGVGAGDLRREMHEKYALRYGGKVEPKMPHSQWLTYLAGTGVLGLSLFLFSFFYPLFEKRRYRQFLFVSFWLIVFVSFFVENTLENNFGVSFYVLFLLQGVIGCFEGEMLCLPFS